MSIVVCLYNIADSYAVFFDKIGVDFRRVYIVNSNAPAEAQELGRRMRHLPIGRIDYRTEVPLALLAVTGPKVVAAVCVEDD